MYTLTVAKTIKAPIDVVFDIFTDHEMLGELPGVRSAKVVRDGETERNGLGAIREIDGGAVFLREEIIGFDRPNTMEYRIRESRPPSEHLYGKVEFASIPEGTVVTWTTVFNALPRPVGKLIEPGAGIVFGIVFRVVLREVAKRAKARQVAGG